MNYFKQEHSGAMLLLPTVVVLLAVLSMLACGEQSERAPGITLNPEATSTPVPAATSNATAVPEQALRGASNSASTPLPQGDATLYRAIWAGTIDEVRSLVAAGADVNADGENGEPLLYTAIWRGRTR